NGKTVLRILAQATPHWPLLLGFVSAIAMVSGVDSYLTFLSKRIVDEGIVMGNREVLVHIVARYGALTLLQSVAVFGFIFMAGRLGDLIRYDLRKKMFEHLQELSFSYFDRTPVGWIMSRVTSDSSRMAELVTWGLLDVTWAVMSIAASVYFMLTINWKLALIVFAIIPVLVVVAAQFKKKIILEFRLVRKINSKITGAYNENIQGVRVIKALCREDENLREFGELSGEMYSASY
ncbi:MAG: ABC transporter ATP-binding protein, partial [Propionibacteriaceae bacterium]|nr:ABC transporter ATP-binding protein [Propionibacteriaceae bacterium]